MEPIQKPGKSSFVEAFHAMLIAGVVASLLWALSSFQLRTAICEHTQYVIDAINWNRLFQHFTVGAITVLIATTAIGRKFFYYISKKDDNEN